MYIFYASTYMYYVLYILYIFSIFVLNVWAGKEKKKKKEGTITQLVLAEKSRKDGIGGIYQMSDCWTRIFC